ncbi:MAG: hypothetical protein ABI414_04145 [Devosia sp.]
MRIIGLVAAACAGAFGGSVAVDAQELALTQAISGHPGLTYFDLVSQIAPGLKSTAKGATAPGGISLRHIEGADWLEGEQDLMSAPAFFHSVDRVDFEAEGQPMMALLTRIAADEVSLGPTALLSVFSAGAVPKLLDAVDVTLDTNTGFGDQATVRIGPHDEALIVANSHFNSQEGYLLETAMMVRNAGIERIDTIQTLSIRYCSFSLDQDLSFTADTSAQGQFWPLTVTIAQTHSPSQDNCDLSQDPAPQDMTASVPYHWDEQAGAYVGNQTPFAVFTEQ